MLVMNVRRVAASVLVALLGLLVASCCIDGGVHDTPAGTLSISIENLNRLAGPGTSFISVTYSGNVITSSSDQNIGSFSFAQKYEVGPNGITPQPDITRHGLREGKWSVTVAAPGWSAECQVDLGTKTTPKLVFQAGEAGCSPVVP